MMEPPVPKVPMDYTWAKRLGLVRKPANFISSISDDRGDELRLVFDKRTPVYPILVSPILREVVYISSGECNYPATQECQ